MTGGLPPIIGHSPAIRRAAQLIDRYATTGIPILLVGATGTGKELFVQHVHKGSGRAGELVDVDCGALPRDMVEGLLLGYRRGAFTGALTDRVGLIEQSHGGTLFLDEVTSLSEDAQRKLLRVLDTAEVRRLGETRKRAVDLRIVAAAQDELDDQVSDRQFRRDLYERLAGVVVRLPRLVERREDVLLLAKHFAELQGQCLEPDAERVLQDYSWPGNVRELRKVITRVKPMVSNGTLSGAVIEEAIALGSPASKHAEMGLTRWEVLRRMTRSELRAECEKHGCDARRIASALGVGRTTLFKHLRNIGLSLKRSSQFARSRPV